MKLVYDCFPIRFIFFIFTYFSCCYNNDKTSKQLKTSKIWNDRFLKNSSSNFHFQEVLFMCALLIVWLKDYFFFFIWDQRFKTQLFPLIRFYELFEVGIVLCIPSTHHDCVCRGKVTNSNFKRKNTFIKDWKTFNIFTTIIHSSLWSLGI